MSGLRDIAAGHFAAVLAGPAGIGEALVYSPVNGVATSVRGVWSQSGADPDESIGVGMASAHGDATVRIPLVDVPTHDPAATITRTATGETWRQSRPARLTPGVGWLLFLHRSSPVAGRGVL